MEDFFSGRVPGDGRLNRWARCRDRRDRGGPTYLDLTVSNPTLTGLPPGSEAVAALAREDVAEYRPAPRGLPGARQAVSRDLRRHGADVDADHVVLTASTSEAYAFLFKILCDAGESILIPAPGYPLFDHLAALESVRPVHYRLDLDGAWALDPDALRSRLSPDTRVLILISPHNPTGWRLPESQRDEIEHLAAERGVAVIADEVFADFLAASVPGPDGPPAPPVLAARAGAGLWFTLGGLSKSAGLPQMKVSWIVVGGAPALRDAALDRLETVADAALSVATPPQLALPDWLAGAGRFRRAAGQRLQANRRALQRVVDAFPRCELVPSGGGWSALLRLPATRSDEDDALALLAEHDVLVQPGYLYDLAGGTFLVISLLVEPETLAAALPRLAAYLSRR